MQLFLRYVGGMKAVIFRTEPVFIVGAASLQCFCGCTLTRCASTQVLSSVNSFAGFAYDDAAISVYRNIKFNNLRFRIDCEIAWKMGKEH